MTSSRRTMVALADCAGRYRQDRGVTFTQYAGPRIRGAMLDKLRTADWATRGVRFGQRTLNDAAGAFATRNGRTATNAELADAVGVAVEDLHRLRHSIDQALSLSLESVTSAGFDPRSTSASPEETIVRRERIGMVRDAVAELPERLRDVIVRFFYGDERMADIGLSLGVSESRVSQMCHEALRMLRIGIDRQDTGIRAPTPSAQRRKSRKEQQIDTYVAAIAARSSLAQRLSLTSTLGDAIPSDGELAA